MVVRNGGLIGNFEIEQLFIKTRKKI